MPRTTPTRRPFRPTLLPLEDRLTPAYAFGATTFAATNLELGQPGVTVLDMRIGANPNDEATANLSLGANAFRFYGDVATGANALTVSVNGNISLGGPLESAGPTDFVNTGLTGLEEATGRGTIAPLWDDWLATSSEPAVVLYKVAGNQLVIEWQKLKHASLTGAQASEVNFQAVLELNTGSRPGDITFNYLDTDADTTNATGVDGGGSATIGVRAAGFDDATDPNPGAQRTLVSFDEATTMAAGGAAVALVWANTAPAVTAFEATPDAISEGGQVSVSGAFDDADTTDTHAVTVSWGDGTPDTVVALAAGVTDFAGITHTYADNPAAAPNGSFTVTVTVADLLSTSAAASADVQVSNIPLVLSVGGAAAVDEAGTLARTITFTDRAGDGPHTATVDWGDGTPAVALGTVASPFVVSRAYPLSGAYTVTVTVADKDGAAVSESFDLAVANVTPAVTAAADQTGVEGIGAAVALGSFADPGAAGDGPYSVVVAWGDGTPDTTFTVAAPGALPAVAHAFPNDGSYTVQVTVTDADGVAGSGSFAVAVSDVPPAMTPPADRTVSEGALNFFGFGSFADVPADAPFTLTVDWGDGSDPLVAPGGTFDGVHTYLNDGTFTLTVTVTDASGVSSFSTSTVVVSNGDPVAAILGAPATAPEGTPVTLGSSAADPGPLDVLTRAWVVTKDGIPFAADGDTADFTFTPDDAGEYVVTLTVTDGDGGVVTAAATVTAENAPPVVAIVGAPAAVVEGSPVIVEAEASDPGNDALTYAWTVTRDGAVVSAGSGTGHAFTPDDEGEYVVTVTVGDGAGGETTAAVTIDATNADPTAAVTGAPATSPEGTPVTLGSIATDPGTADVLTRAWSVTKNGAAFADGSGPTITFTPDDEGSYVVTLTVTDGDGGTATDAATVTVGNVAPTAAITGTPATSVEGAAVALGSTATDPGSDTLSRSWGVTKNGQPFGAGGSGTAFSFTPDDEGSYVVTLTVTDDDGGTTTATATVAVTNANPTVTPDATAVGGPEGSPITNTGRFGDAGADDVTLTASVGVVVQQPDGSWSWSFTPADDDAPGVPAGVTITATDGDGGTAATTFALTVSNVAPVLTVVSDQVAVEGTQLEVAGLGAFADVGTGASETFTATIDWGDGTAAETVPVTGAFGGGHTYADDGTYTVTVTLADDDGGADVKTFRVAVANAAPGVRLVAPESAVGGVPVTLTAVGSDVGADPLAFAWTVADDRGAVVATGAGAAFTFTPARGGVHTVEVVASDGDGGSAAATATLAVRVADVTATGTTGADGSLVRVVKADGTTTDLVAFGSAFTGAVRAATGDVDGDGIADVVVVAGPGGGPHVRVFSGADMSVIRDFFAYEDSFRGGLFVAVADVDGDGRADIVTGPDVGGGPVVKVFGGADGRLVFSQLAYEETFRGGVRVAAGDLDGDGRAEVVTGAGTGGSPRVVAFDPRTGTRVADFMAGDSTGTAGVRVSARDADADGTAEIATTVPGVRGGRFWDVTAAGAAEDTGVLFDGVFIDAPV